MRHDEPATERFALRSPRHRATHPVDQSWRVEGVAPRRRRSLEADTANPGDVQFPGTGSLRNLMGTWRTTDEADDVDGDVETTRFAVLDPVTASASAHPTAISDPHRITDPETDTRSPVWRRTTDVTPTGPSADTSREWGSSEAIDKATGFPDAPPPVERGVRAYFRHFGILIRRQLTVWVRDRGTLIQSLVFPALSMVMFKVVLGDSVSRFTGVNSAFGTVPLVVLVGAMFGSMASGVRLQQERKTGLLTKFYVLPVHRGADLSARLCAEMVRILLATLVLTTIGFAIGWRFNQGVLPAVGIYAVALLYGAAFSTLVLALALTSSDVPLVGFVSLASTILMFFNSGFAPIIAYPNWLQPIVRNQPMTCAIEVMRALAMGGPITDNLIKTVIWAMVVVAIFAYPALRAYRRAASTPV
ncbi:ABC transporter permease [Williamsia sterculiae]|uniref:Transport permease protein n=1 Tax=Williamsia sterculiae TaxID=1344003 RepID=A0A1N7GQI2_9NOCA|nr:ABC transporter permease [Williamsia sterculiae]SIS14833.1 ABC-2 type transport system permease protein [Williamsia sterculiae]